MYIYIERERFKFSHVSPTEYDSHGKIIFQTWKKKLGKNDEKPGKKKTLKKMGPQVPLFRQPMWDLFLSATSGSTSRHTYGNWKNPPFQRKNRSIFPGLKLVTLGIDGLFSSMVYRTVL